ncbi:MAG: alpha/beta fold hydrolase [Gemmataceae bacterium]|nr:alpha/beta fold hydrolase [Gemmataceae bacterium]MDW8263703.1 alpha/beta fold hydrolase [Gemmataceae bacterium]
MGDLFEGEHRAVLVDLVRTQTRDGLRLDGIYLEPIGPPQVPVGGMVFIHGTGGSFYTSSLFDDLAERLRRSGCGVLRVNTRGHDGISTALTSQGGRRLGAAYEIVDDCRHDLAAWTEWLRQRVGGPVGLLGHSLGAVKAVYALAHEPSLRVGALVAVSPPRLSYSWFCQSPEGPEFLRTYAEAQRLVEAGQPTALMEVSLPLPSVVTAAGYVEKYGPEERYNYLRFLGEVPCPVLVTFGEVEVSTNMAFRGAPEAAAAVPRRGGTLAVVTIPGGDHFYTTTRDEIAAAIDHWLRSLNVAARSSP